ncbi:unnamed protein product [Clonostachys rosea]|uniref:C2H2-type domain-containing protein n=1 Tax=Bionectria ochroleuca TaxID=29856 RepID=A0ABY6UEI0_BIOOC|nr:unnamed protein product [Clonostachys rosea]
MVVESSLWDWVLVVLSATLIAQGIQYVHHVQCAESPGFSWPAALRPVIEAVVDIANSAVEFVAAASFSSPRSLPRTVRRRHEREKEKRTARALKRSSSAKIHASRASAKQTAPDDTTKGEAPAGIAQPLGCNRDNECSQAVSKACSKANSDLKAEAAGAQLATCYFINYVSSADNNILCHEANEAESKPSESAAPCDTPLDAPHDGACKPVVVHPPRQLDESTYLESSIAAACAPRAAHDKDKWQAGDQSQGIFLRWVLPYAILSAGIVSFGGVPQGSQSTGGFANGANGAEGRSSRGSGNNKKGTGKRKRGHDDGREDKKRGAPGPLHRHEDEGEWDGRFLACPYYKMDPHRYSRCWAKYELKRFADVKQHLIRCHKVKEYYCSRCCLVEFEDHAAWQLHSQSCNEPNSASGPENFTMDEIDHLAHAPRGATDERKYYWVWENFFFNHPKPESPYVPDYLTETRSIHSPDFQAALQAALLSPPPAIALEQREGEDRTAWAQRLSDYLGPRMLELASEAEHPRRFRFPPSAAHARAHAPLPHANHLHAHLHANHPAVALQQPQQPQQPLSQPQPQPHPHPQPKPQPVAPARAPAAAGLFPTVAHQLQVPPPLSPHHQTSLPHRVQHSPAAAAQAASAAASPSGIPTTISPSLLHTGIGMNAYYQYPHPQPRPRQHSHRPALHASTPVVNQMEIPIDPRLSYADPPPPPPAPQGPPANITNQAANTDLSDDDDDDNEIIDYGAMFSLP